MTHAAGHGATVTLTLEGDDITVIVTCAICGRQEYWLPRAHLGLLARVFIETADREDLLAEAGAQGYLLEIVTGPGGPDVDGPTPVVKASALADLAEALARGRKADTN